MRIAIVSASNKQPDWIRTGFAHYAKRLGGGACTLELVEVALGKRSAAKPAAAALEMEGERMLAALPKGAHVVALDERGTAWSTAELATRLERWMSLGRPVALLVGGPDGLAPRCLALARERWALSALTLPHGLVRVVAAEALYRAWSVVQGHPYHRA
jgi:23S rRNA (pseudouridine1915-N3)-methyltransferase